MPTPYTLGAHPSPPDTRDYRIQAFLPVERTPLPPSRDFRPLMQPVRNQGGEGTCVGHALASGVMGFQERTQPNTAKPFDRTLAVRDAYAGARQLEPVWGEGAQPRAALKYAQQQGLCLEADWPYQAQRPGAPGPAALGNRARNRLATYASVNARDVQAIKEALYWHGPALAVLEVTDGFWTPDAAGRVAHRGAAHGYHAVCLAGYDDARSAFLLRNSWGPEWGQAGYCWLPYEHPLVECWSATPALVENAPKPPEKPWWGWLLGW